MFVGYNAEEEWHCKESSADLRKKCRLSNRAVDRTNMEEWRRPLLKSATLVPSEILIRPSINFNPQCLMLYGTIQFL
jgi:hypothetical protein